MKVLLTVIALTLVSATHAATSNLESEKKMKECVSSIYSQAAKSNLSSKDTMKGVSTGIKDCRKLVSDIKKKEQSAKKLANKAKRIQKLKEQLNKLTSN